MRFGTYPVFQCPPGKAPARVVAEEIARAELAEALGFDDIWLPEQHFSPCCLAGAALLVAGHLAARTRHVRIGTAQEADGRERLRAAHAAGGAPAKVSLSNFSARCVDLF